VETIQGLINHLNTIEDKEQAVVFQYYLAEHFDTTLENFARVSRELDGILPAYEDNYAAMIELIERGN
jgi:hypothetical protein